MATTVLRILLDPLSLTRSIYEVSSQNSLMSWSAPKKHCSLNASYGCRCTVTCRAKQCVYTPLLLERPREDIFVFTSSSELCDSTGQWRRRRRLQPATIMISDGVDDWPFRRCCLVPSSTMCLNSSSAAYLTPVSSSHDLLLVGNARRGMMGF